MNTELSICDYCVGITQHVDLLLEEYKRDDTKATIQELKCYYWLTSFFENHLCQCNCPQKESYEDSVLAIKIILDYKNIELKKELMKCDICKTLPYEFFALLDVACKIDNEDSMNSMYNELYYHVFLSLLYEENLGRCTECDHFVEYISNLEKTCEFLYSKDLDRLQDYVYYWKKARNHDEIFSLADELRDKHSFELSFSSQEIEISERTSIYLDFNIFARYEDKDNPLVKLFFDEIIKDNNINFLCSPVHLEETLRINNEFFELQRVENIKKLTKGQCVTEKDEKLVFCVEDLDGRFNHVKKYAKMNYSAEEKNCIEIDSLEQRFNKYRDEKSLTLIGNVTLDEMIDNVNSETGDKISESLPDESYINDILSYVGSNDQGIREYKNLFDHKDLTFYTVRTAIVSISSVFNVLGFHADKVTGKKKSKVNYPIYHKDKYRTIRSGFYDNLHLSFATKCKYFVTTDKKLYAKAKDLYGFLGCSTIPIMLEDFMNFDWECPVSALRLPSKKGGF